MDLNEKFEKMLELEGKVYDEETSEMFGTTSEMRHRAKLRKEKYRLEKTQIFDSISNEDLVKYAEFRKANRDRIWWIKPVQNA